MTTLPENLTKKKVGDFSVEEMHRVIDSLHPKEELHAGIKLLHLILEERGVAGLVAFVERAHYILDKEGKLLDYDFDSPDGNRLLARAKPNLMNRRTFLQTAGWGVAGAVGVPYYLSSIGDKAVIKFTHQETSVFHTIHEWVDRYLVPPAELLISVALVNEAVEKWREIKLQEVSNAAAEAAEKLLPPDKHQGSSGPLL